MNHHGKGKCIKAWQNWILPTASYAHQFPPALQTSKALKAYWSFNRQMKRAVPEKLRTKPPNYLLYYYQVSGILWFTNLADRATQGLAPFQICSREISVLEYMLHNAKLQAIKHQDLRFLSLDDGITLCTCPDAHVAVQKVTWCVCVPRYQGTGITRGKCAFLALQALPSANVYPIMGESCDNRCMSLLVDATKQACQLAPQRLKRLI